VEAAVLAVASPAVADAIPEAVAQAAEEEGKIHNKI
jgi:hypothetical protein